MSKKCSTCGSHGCAGGHGLSHNYGSGEDCDRDVSHESHGVSKKWIHDRVSRASNDPNTSSERVKKFFTKADDRVFAHQQQTRWTDKTPTHIKKLDTARFAAFPRIKADQAKVDAEHAAKRLREKKDARNAARRASRAAAKASPTAGGKPKESGWAKWKAKGGHGMQMGSSGYGLSHGYEQDDDFDDDNGHEYR